MPGVKSAPESVVDSACAVVQKSVTIWGGSGDVTMRWVKRISVRPTAQSVADVGAPLRHLATPQLCRRRR